MAYARLVHVASVAVVLVGCAGSGAGPSPAADPRPTQVEPPGSFQGTRWGTFHSKRFELSLALPDGAAWKIDDHRSAWLRATHGPTQSSLSFRSWTEEANVTKKACYARARGWDARLPDLDAGPLIEDKMRKLLGDRDARVAVGVMVREGAEPAIGGFVIAIIGDVRRCMLLAFRTEAEGASAQDEVADRLAIVSDRVLPSMKLDQSFTPSREPPLVPLPVGGAAGGGR
jgi:hypothetical protein